MTALAMEMLDPIPAAPERPRLTPELTRVIHEVAESERALDDLLSRSARLHQAHIEHDPHSCLVCFGS